MSVETTVDAEATDVEIVDPEAQVTTADDIHSFDDVLAAIENTDEEKLLLGDEVFRQVYKEAHGTEKVPDERVQTGQVMTPIVRASARNIEQELSVSIPVILPDGESVKVYTALYGSDNPDPVIDKMLHQYTTGEKRISKLTGVNVPLIYMEGEWKMYLIAQGGVFGIAVHSWLAKNFRALISSEDVVEFGKTYNSPFEDDPALVEEGGVAALEAVSEEHRNR